MKTMRICGHFGCVVVLLAAIGCGGTDGPKVVPVKGKITVGKSEPFKKGWVIFSPKPGSKYTGGAAVTDDAGNYVLKHTSQKPGVEPGDYNVSFSLYKMPDGSAIAPDKGNNPKTPQEMGGVQFVPLDMSTILSTKNPTTVPKTGGTFDFDIPELKAQSAKPNAPAKQRRRSNED